MLANKQFCWYPAILSFLAIAFAPLSAHGQCYEQADEDCDEYSHALENLRCNTKECEKEHQVDSMGNKLHQNGFWLMNYDCPANSYEGIVQTGKVYSCDEFGPDAKHASAAAPTEVRCVKLKYCAAGCNVTTETYDPLTFDGVTALVRKAYCKTGGGPLIDCSEEFEGCNVTSQRCSGDCPGEPEGE
jgi:hypothetical protein